MADRGSHAAEEALSTLLLPLCVASGAVVVAGFFFPELAGEVLSDEMWLVFALLFFGSGLGYLALLPIRSPSARRNLIQAIRGTSSRSDAWVHVGRSVTSSSGKIP